MSEKREDCVLASAGQFVVLFAAGLALGWLLTKLLPCNSANRDPWSKPWSESSNPVSSTSVDFS